LTIRQSRERLTLLEAGMRLSLSILALCSLGLSGCGNACQDLCTEMAAFAEDSCGLTWSKDQIKTCQADHKRSETTSEGRSVCADELEGLEDEWSCTDLDAYFDAGGGTDTGS
jgi:hypothetical protein